MKSMNRLPPRGHPLTLSDVAGIFTLTPKTDYATLIPRQTADQRMNAAWNRTIQQMQKAFAQVQVRHPFPRLERRVD